MEKWVIVAFLACCTILQGGEGTEPGSECARTCEDRDDLVCQEGVCKLTAGANCTLYKGQCVAGTTCECQTGDGTDRQCKLMAGGDCTSDANLCMNLTVCEDSMGQKTCKLMAGGDCTSDANFCMKLTVCEDEDTMGQKTCKLHIGEDCESKGEQCLSSAFCENNNGEYMCKHKVGEECEADHDCPLNAQCAGSAVSDAIGDDHRCQCHHDYTIYKRTTCIESGGQPALPVSTLLVLISVLSTRFF